MCKGCTFQLTRPRGARHIPCPLLCRSRQVSTHAPAWGATYMDQSIEVSANVSTHAPAWGATSRIFEGACPTHVSTHAPAWGATAGDGGSGTGNRSFNSRARVGRDIKLAIPGGQVNMFQLTRPRGARPISPAGRAKSRRFQLTRPRGARLADVRLLRVSMMFQLTRPRGARP